MTSHSQRLIARMSFISRLQWFKFFPAFVWGLFTPRAKQTALNLRITSSK
jgi:hypothetical protein